ncbi:YegP family protein [Stenotrophomonas sp. 24(2023)]|uniref:YegP family protein n=1 Tax=Stenotrophomonas sp. 24(2023) TaxID=3068324 RepID=UPI0027DF04F3|nr:YegP family protein [Stenotrophomonas sp. 24(2023)]WMJ69252.1 YegP family protein [Stenotrophomonas sp. 24(2023)]
MAARYELKASGTQFHFVLKAGNGEVILTGERYTTKQNAMNGIASVKANAPLDARYERKTSSNGSPMFNLKAANGEVIGTSEQYSSTAGREAGIQSVKNNGPSAPVVDLT